VFVVQIHLFEVNIPSLLCEENPLKTLEDLLHSVDSLQRTAVLRASANAAGDTAVFAAATGTRSSAAPSPSPSPLPSPSPSSSSVKEQAAAPSSSVKRTATYRSPAAMAREAQEKREQQQQPQGTPFPPNTPASHASARTPEPKTPAAAATLQSFTSTKPSSGAVPRTPAAASAQAGSAFSFSKRGLFSPPGSTFSTPAQTPRGLSGGDNGYKVDEEGTGTSGNGSGMSLEPALSFGPELSFVIVDEVRQIFSCFQAIFLLVLNYFRCKILRLMP
jgi:hypothetical protein